MFKFTKSDGTTGEIPALGRDHPMREHLFKVGCLLQDRLNRKMADLRDLDTDHREKVKKLSDEFAAGTRQLREDVQFLKGRIEGLQDALNVLDGKDE